MTKYTSGYLVSRRDERRTTKDERQRCEPLLAQGQANKQIAGNLQIGEKTVKTHVSNILAKLSVPSRTQAALYAVRIGLVSADQLRGDER
jgi:DNA-binding NarL/FixJ family response regulator